MGMIPKQRINMSPTSNESIYFQETFKFVKTRRDVIKSYPQTKETFTYLRKHIAAWKNFLKTILGNGFSFTN